MANKRIIVLDRRTFTFTGLAASQSQTTVLERAFDVLGAREATLQIVVHSQTYASTQTLTVTATPIQLVESEPQTDYLASTGAAATATFTTATGGRLIAAQLTSGFGSHVQLAINATQPAAAAALSCTISVIMVLKD